MTQSISQNGHSTASCSTPRPTVRSTIIFLDGNEIHRQERGALALNDLFIERYVVIKHNLFHVKCSCNASDYIAQGLDMTVQQLEVI